MHETSRSAYQEDRWSRTPTSVSKVKQPLDLKGLVAGGTYAVDAYYTVPALSITSKGNTARLVGLGCRSTIESGDLGRARKMTSEPDYHV